MYNQKVKKKNNIDQNATACKVDYVSGAHTRRNNTKPKKKKFCQSTSKGQHLIIGCHAA